MIINKSQLLGAVCGYAFLTCLSIPAMAADAYLCISEHAAGIDYDVKKKVWYPTFFTTGNKFVARKVKNKNHAWEIRKMGTDYIWSHCKTDININGYLSCGGVERRDFPRDFPFELNIQTLRFVIAYEGSYAVHKKMYEEDEINKGKANDPSVVIGTCSPI